MKNQAKAINKAIDALIDLEDFGLMRPEFSTALNKLRSLAYDYNFQES